MAGNAVIGALRVVLGADTAALDKGLKDAQSSLARFATQVKNVGLVAAGALAGALGGTAVAMKSMVDHADKMGKAAQSFGVPVAELSRLNHAADLSGVSMESLGKSMGRLSKSMMEVAGGAENNVSQTLNALGITVKNTDGTLKSASQVMTEVAGKFAGMQDGAGKTALAMNLFGKSGAELIPMLNAGKTGLQEMMQEADHLGIVIDTKTARSAEAFNDNLTRLLRVKDGFILKITQELLPAMQLLSQRFIDAAKDSSAFQSAAVWVANAIKAIVSEAFAGALAIQRLGAEVRALWAVFTAKGDKNISAAWDAFIESGKETERQFANLRQTVGEFWQTAANNAEAGAAETGNKIAAPIVVASEVAKKAASEAEAALKKILDAGKRTFEQTRTPAEQFALTMQKINEQYQAGAFGADTYARAVAQAQDKLVQATPAAQMLESALTSAFDRAIDGGMKLQDQIAALIKDLGRMAAQAAFKSLLFGNAGSGGTFTGLLGGMFGGARAMGGPVAAGVPYLIGERGPEMFVPKVPGQVVSNRDLAGGFAGGVNVSFAPVYNVQGSGPEIAALRAQMARDRAEFPARVTAAVRDGRARRML